MSAFGLLAPVLVLRVLEDGFAQAARDLWRIQTVSVELVDDVPGAFRVECGDLGRRLTAEEAHELANAVVSYGEKAATTYDPALSDDFREAAKDLARWIRDTWGSGDETLSYGPSLASLVLKWPDRKAATAP